MILWHRKNEQEQVEFIRKLLVRSKWLGFFHAVGAVLCWAAALWFWSFMADILEVRLADAHKGGIIIGISLGLLPGLFLAFGLTNLVWAGQYFWGHPTERLLIKYYDMVKTGDSQPTDGEVSSESVLSDELSS